MTYENYVSLIPLPSDVASVPPINILSIAFFCVFTYSSLFLYSFQCRDKMAVLENGLTVKVSWIIIFLRVVFMCYIAHFCN